ncbi:MAG: ATP-dependent DNA helicase [Clostridiaceae bacterium]|nr:ATP-dependent DNA helicase [Clostridiaceae bacterium]
MATIQQRDFTSNSDKPERPVVRIAVRSLAETVHRHGGLSGPAYGGVAAVDGIRLHQRFAASLTDRHADAAVHIELALLCDFEADALHLQVSGRCDALVANPESGFYQLIEAKSFSGSPDRLPPQGESVHWAQAELYGWLFLKEHPDLDQLSVGLVYVGLDSPEWLELHKTFSRGELAAFFQDTCRHYADFTANLLHSKKLRDQSGLECRFPYPALRSGQKRFMQEVVGTARQKSCLFIQAPTGIGKTMAALYPAVKILANHWVDHVFYLTHMTSARLVAARALEDLRRSGLLMKGIILYAKEKMCLMPDLYCDSRQCPYALSYYDHLPAALRRLFLLEQIGREEIIACAREHEVCPFELSLDMAVYCEIIVCDYNYAFDPRVRLDRFFNQELQTHLLLVDEAHNLPARSRGMYSAALNSLELADTRKAIQGQAPQLEQQLDKILLYFDKINHALEGQDAVFDQLERLVRPDDVMKAEQFRAMRNLPADLIALSARFSFFCHEFLEEHPDFPGRQSLLKGLFKLLFFNRVAEEFFGADYVTVARKTADGAAEVELMCLDAADKLAACYLKKHPTVFFSATLSPLEYYMGLLQGRPVSESTEKLLLGSPFPPENLLVMICSQLSTRYRQRQDTIQAILRLILAAVGQRTGNYLVFVPSFAYLSLLRSLLRNCPESRNIDCLFQIPEMNERLRQKFLNRFEQFGRKTLLAVAVIGGVFSEGIDLTGEKLTGVVIVGVGLPQICPEREIMRQYYGQALGSGYEYAYLYPGFNKVQQGAGRVIRSEEDRGFVLLIDDRYDTEVYRSLFPAEWHPVPVTQESEVSSVLQVFWGEGKPVSG